MGRPPVAFPVSGNEDIRAFFDGLAPGFRELHGPARRLLRHRVALIKKHASVDKGATILEIGCGRGDHLLALVEAGLHGVGIDLSPAMIRAARARVRSSRLEGRAFFLEANAEDLSCLKEDSFDVALAVGAFEHMVDKPAVLKSLFRVLKPGGCFICLSPNGAFLWYSRLAPRLGINTKHLASDIFLSRPEFGRLLRRAGFSDPSVAYWRFIPRGDVPSAWALTLGALDAAGRVVPWSKLRGGILVKALKPGSRGGGRKDPGDESGV
jgi:2-polyprenyl-6-hydroxyphenyl methylase/3-demethylubiquinone-9 3-methyltransferase